MPDTVAEFKLDYSVVDESGSVAALIVAAGSSSRMKGINKLFAPLLGIPVLARTPLQKKALPMLKNCAVSIIYQNLPT